MAILVNWPLRPRPRPALFRLAKILWITLRFGLDEFALASGAG